MKRIIIICEGQTEVAFCKDVLYPYFSTKNIYISNPLIKKSKGGIVHWARLQKEIENHLNQDKNAIVTTFIDYYGIQKKHEFPEWEKAHKESDKNERMAILEKGMKNTLTDDIQYRFFPNIQLHEFEGLLFNNLEVFIKNFAAEELLDRKELEETIENNPNPELINDTPNNAPSKRLHRLIFGYNKVVYGSILAQDIGLVRLREKSPRFNQWITKLEMI